MVCTVAIPWLTGRAVDRISAGDRDGLRDIAIAVVIVAVVRLGLSVLRRLVAGQVSLAIEYDLRNLIYAHLQKLEMGFFAGQQTGQLMSRATVDLSSVRFFLGYGLVFILQSGLTILLGAAAMFLLQPGLAAMALIPVPFVVRGGDALREPLATGAAGGAAADRRGHGRRRGEHLRCARREGLRGRAAPARPLPRLGGARLRPVDDRDPDARVLQPVPGLPAEPRAGRDPARRRAPGRQRHADAGRLHRVLHVPADADRADADARRRARDGAARDRVRRAAAGDPRPRAGDRERLGGAPRGPRARGAARRDVRLRRRAGRAARRLARGRAGFHRRPRGRDRLGQDDARATAAAAVRPALRRGADRRRRRARRGHRRAAQRDRGGRRRPVPVLGHGRGQHRLRPAGRLARGDRTGRRSARRPPGSSPSCPTATTRASASAG